MKRNKLIQQPMSKIIEDTIDQLDLLKKLCQGNKTQLGIQVEPLKELLWLSEVNPFLVSSVCGFVPEDEIKAKEALLCGKNFFDRCRGFPKLRAFKDMLYNKKTRDKNLVRKNLQVIKKEWLSARRRRDRSCLYGEAVAGFENDIFYCVQNNIGMATAIRWLSARHLVSFVSSKGRYVEVSTSINRKSGRFAETKEKKERPRKCAAGKYVKLQNECVLELFLRAINIYSQEKITSQNIALAILVVVVVCSSLDVWNASIELKQWFILVEKIIAGKTPFAKKR